MADNEKFLALLRETFRDEAGEHLAAMRSGLLSLEGDMRDEERLKLISSVYRAAHSLKGASRAVDFTDIETLCQALESLFQAAQKGKLAMKRPVFDAVHATLDTMDRVLAEPEGERKGFVSDSVAAIRALVESEGNFGYRATARRDIPTQEASAQPSNPEPDARAEAQATVPAEVHPKASSACVETPSLSESPHARAQTIRLPVERLDRMLFQAEEMLSVKLALSRHVAELKDFRERDEEIESSWSGMIPLLERLVAAARAANPADANALDEFIASQRTGRKRTSRGMDRIIRSAENDSRVIGTMVDDLLNEAKRLLLMPLSSISGGFSKLVRDLGRDLDKEIAFSIEGDDVELEKRILEKLKDPLIHLLRNAVDHGIESPAARAALGKPPGGSIVLSVSRLGGDRVELILADDGSGVDPVRLKKSLVDSGQLEAEAAELMEGESLLGMIFRPGISTSGKVTEISGNGLGMSIAQEAAESLGGTIHIESRSGWGMKVRMTVPVTKATFRGILVRISGRLFVIPTAVVSLVSRAGSAVAGSAEIGSVEGALVIRMDSLPCGIVSLADILGIGTQTSSSQEGKIRFIVVEAAGTRVAFLVDEVLDELEVLVKPLGPRLRGLGFISGLAILGTGELVPILDGRNLVLSATEAKPTARQSGSPMPASKTPGGGGRSVSGEAVRTGPSSILIVEDSITSRLLLKNILEAAGYAVSTAVDGLEGFAALKSGRFDLVVSDIEMPRMDGFHLTQKIRADETVSKTPVILVTSLESRENRERGVDSGADAYLVKSGFEQGILLDTIRRLL
jgi:two-component system chemotaxis sensor kinase CheA